MRRSGMALALSCMTMVGCTPFAEGFTYGFSPTNELAWRAPEKIREKATIGAWSTDSTWRAKVVRDEHAGTTNVTGPWLRLDERPSDFEGVWIALRSFVAAGEPTVHQVYVEHHIVGKRADWPAFHDAKLLSQHPVEFVDIDTDVVAKPQCVTLTTIFALRMSDEVMASAAADGIDAKVYGRRAQLRLVVPAEVFRAQLDAIATAAPPE